MRETSAQGEPSFDPFGEPMDVPKSCAGGRGYGETRRAAIVFWVLALLLVGSRVYFSDPATVPGATGKGVQVSDIR